MEWESDCHWSSKEQLDARKQKLQCFKDVKENYFHPKILYLANKGRRLKHENTQKM